MIERELLDVTASEIVFGMLRECDRSFDEICYHNVIRVLKEEYNIEINIVVIGEEERKLLSEIFR